MILVTMRHTLRIDSMLAKLRWGPLNITNCRPIFVSFKENETFAVKYGRSHKTIWNADSWRNYDCSHRSNKYSHDTSSACATFRFLNIFYLTQSNILKFYPYKISETHKLLFGDKKARKSFALLFLSRTAVDISWYWQI